jgi:predicted small integral membrane protein
MINRLAKTALTAALGFFMLLVVFGNLSDYGANYGFVSHVLAMDTTFPGNTIMWRSIQSVPVYHVFYAFLILWEAAASVLLFVGAWKLWGARHRSAVAFNQAKSLGVAGLTLNLLQWLVAFLSVGGEWFAMWQSKIWNGQEPAARMFVVAGIILIFLNSRDEELLPKS